MSLERKILKAEVHFFLPPLATEKSNSNQDIAIEMLQILKQGYPSFLSVIIYLIDFIFYTLKKIQIIFSSK